MRDRYEDSPGETRDASVRRLGRLTWRATQLGTLAAVGFAVVFARNAPAQTTSVQNPPTATPTASATTATTAASATPSQHAVTRARVTGSPTQKLAVAQPSAPVAQQAAPTTVATTPQLAPPTTAPAPAPTTATPAPTTSSASHGGG
jgi:peptidoglycan DL-endopeptidase CwlO